ncbi:MAG: LLM class F420-dependent oxidoreductase [Rhodospirillaceae bacterium]|nr:LLM class F420-dependent oxidoreductase [Rhodospirillaceae bacterium]
MTKPSGLGIFCSTHILDPDGLMGLAEGVERRGYETLWYPEALSYDCFTMGGYLLSRTSYLQIASGIANIYARDAVTSAQGHDSLNRMYGGRFVLGLGVSHVPLVEGARGHDYKKPLATMRTYLATMARADIDPTIRVEERDIVLAALGPKMLSLSAEMTKGSLPYCVTPEHTAEARDIMGDKAWLCVEQKVCMTADKDRAHQVARQQMARYMALDNYRNNWFRLGFTVDEVTGDGAPRFLDAMVIWGGEKQIRDAIESHKRAGADQVVLQMLRPDGGSGADPRTLDAFAPAG